MYGNICFENNMDNVTVDENCERLCPNECNTITYSFTFVSTPFDPMKMCPKKIGTKDFLMKQFYIAKAPPKYVRILKEISKNESSEDDDICKKNIQYRAEINFRVAVTTIPVTIMSRRLSFFDQLSAFGKQITFTQQ